MVQGEQHRGRGRKVMKIPSIILYKISLILLEKSKMSKKWGRDIDQPWKQLKSLHKAAGISKWKDFLRTFHTCFSSTSFGSPSMYWHPRHVSHIF